MLEAFNFYALMHITYTSLTLNVQQGFNSVCLLNYSTIKEKILCKSQLSAVARKIILCDFVLKL